MDGFSSCEEIIKRAKELGMSSIGISDHGTCAGHIEFLECANKNNIQPILGIEMYCCFEPAPFKKLRDYTHIVIWAKNTKRST